MNYTYDFDKCSTGTEWLQLDKFCNHINDTCDSFVLEIEYIYPVILFVPETEYISRDF